MISIVISTKNRKELLKTTLEAIATTPDLNNIIKEIIIINDGDDDLTDLAKLHQATLLKNRKSGLASGRNTGASNATAEFVLFYDDDILPSPHHFKRQLEVQKKHPNSIVTANRFYPEELINIASKKPFGRYKLKHEYNWVEGLDLQKANNEDGLFYTNGAAGFSCCMPKKLWEQLNGYNEDFQYAGCEDSEFFYRARRSGAKLMFDETNICYHNELDNFTLKKWIARQASGIKGAIVITSLHPEGKAHPTYYLNTPINKQDTSTVKKIKRKRTFLANFIIRKIVMVAVNIGETIKLPDSVLFKLYNAAWLGATKHSFMEAYNKMLKAS